MTPLERRFIVAAIVLIKTAEEFRDSFEPDSLEQYKAEETEKLNNAISTLKRMVEK